MASHPRSTLIRMLALATAILVPACSPSGGVVMVNPGELFFTGSLSGANPADQQLHMTAAPALFFGQGSWSATTDRPWLSVAPSSGTLVDGQKVTLTVHVQVSEGWKGPTTTVGAPFVDVNTIAGWGDWTGSAMLVWGGEPTVPGKYYDPVSDTWFGTTSTVGAPSQRSSHTAVWTGTELIIWGGHSITPFVALNTGARYNPATDTWTPTSTVGAPSARSGHRAIWTGSRMIVWGGDGLGFTYTNTGGIYDPTTDTWTGATSTVGAPSPRGSHAAVWTGTRMLIWGGENPGKFNDGKFYNPVTDTWSGATTLTGAPSARSHLRGIWTGQDMIVWGGSTGPGVQLDTGARYNPVTDVWVDLPLSGAPSARSSHNLVWTGAEMIAWGGVDNASWLNTGAIYAPSYASVGVQTGVVKITAVSGPAKSVHTVRMSLTVTP